DQGLLPAALRAGRRLVRLPGRPAGVAGHLRRAPALLRRDGELGEHLAGPSGPADARRHAGLRRDAGGPDRLLPRLQAPRAVPGPDPDVPDPGGLPGRVRGPAGDVGPVAQPDLRDPQRVSLGDPRPGLEHPLAGDLDDIGPGAVHLRTVLLPQDRAAFRRLRLTTAHPESR